MTGEWTNSEEFLACILPSSDLAPRRAEIQRLITQTGSVVATIDGVLFTFQNTDQIAHALVDFIRFEQHCCAAIAYVIRSEAPHTELILQLHAPPALVASIQNFYVCDETQAIDVRV
jgi:hypothetical protein